MKTEIAVAIGLFVSMLGAPARAQPADYSRGYYDCLAGRYDPDAESHAYRQGCRAAQREQERGPGGPPPPGPGWGPNGERPGDGGGGPGWGQNGGGWNGGGRPPVAGGVPNVRGLQPGQVMGAMAGAGFRNVGTEVSGPAIYGFYFNPATGQCIQVANMNGRAIGATPTANPRCR
ncbi:hypothetical protein DFR50_12519 [Roseiarcus fermentans]|uniref:YpeB-like protein with protease inhibitory function n=1 Tax=Roseiarcus fermentans TaxID=1473586 RepID=A0A366F1R3_9HYPH|nr:hypothetical protein [Roseiarcus fermentans]RBP08537.1 hypothetical protein DFR50_12519 [Roseiarcus fermentans]